MERKKGIQLNQAFGAVLALVLVAVLVIVGILVFVNLATAFAGTNSLSVVNESVTPTDAGVLLAGSSNCSAGDFSVTQARNGTIGPIIDAGNFTVNSDTGLFQNLTSEFTTVAWLVDYSFTDGSAACDASDNLVVQFGTYPALVGLVGTIIFLGLVIGVLVASFLFTGRRGA